MNQIGILYDMVVVSQDIENLVLQTFFISIKTQFTSCYD